MKQAHITLSLATLALGVAACGSSSATSRPETASSMTTTTGGQTAAPSPSTVPADVDDLTTTLASSGPLPDLPPAAPRSQDSASSHKHPDASMTDAQIAAIADAASLSEREQAREALKRSTSERVRELAHLMLTDHNAWKLERIERDASLAPTDTPESTGLRVSGSQIVASLRAVSSAGFDKLYVDTQVSEAGQMMALLDDKLIPQVQNGALREVMQDLHASTSRYLAMATDIQSSMTK